MGLQYERGCRRSHACHLSIPLAQPFRWVVLIHRRHEHVLAATTVYRSNSPSMAVSPGCRGFVTMQAPPHQSWVQMCCRVHVRAWEVGGKRLAVQATLTSRCAQAVTITACHTQPQAQGHKVVSVLALEVLFLLRAHMAVTSV